MEMPEIKQIHVACDYDIDQIVYKQNTFFRCQEKAGGQRLSSALCDSVSLL